MKIRIYWKHGGHTDHECTRFGWMDAEVRDLRNVLRIDQLGEDGNPLLASGVYRCCYNPNPQTFGPNEFLVTPHTVCMNCGRLYDDQGNPKTVTGVSSCWGGKEYGAAAEMIQAAGIRLADKLRQEFGEPIAKASPLITHNCPRLVGTPVLQYGESCPGCGWLCAEDSYMDAKEAKRSCCDWNAPEEFTCHCDDVCEKRVAEFTGVTKDAIKKEPMRKRCVMCDGTRRTARYGRKEDGEPHIVSGDCPRCTGKQEPSTEARDCNTCGNDPEYVERCNTCGGSGKKFDDPTK